MERGKGRPRLPTNSPEEKALRAYWRRQKLEAIERKKRLDKYIHS